MSIRQGGQPRDAKARARARGADLARKLNMLAGLDRACPGSTVTTNPCRGRAAKAEQESQQMSREAKVDEDRKQCMDNDPGAAGSVAAIPLPKTLLPQPEDMSSKTPTMTSLALTETALRKSELLLAEFATLDLSDTGVKDKCEDLESAMTEESCPNSLCLSPRVESVSSDLPDTIEVPVALLESFAETCSHFCNQQSLSACEANVCDRSESGEAHAADPKARSGSESEVSSTRASSCMDDVGSAEGSVGHASPPTSLQRPLLRCLSPPRESVQPPTITKRWLSPCARRAVSPTISQQRWNANAMLGRALPPVHVNPRMCRQASPRTSFPTLLPKVGSCKIEVQQTITVTNTVHVSFEMA